MTHRPTRQSWPLAALALIALIGAGCSNTPADNGKSAKTNSGQALKFSQCMRENGVSEFPDPDASGELTIDGVVNGSSIDPSSPAWKAAVSACKDLQPPGFTGAKPTPDQQAVRLEFAQCMRDNGVEDFPDPASDQPLVDTNRIPSSATQAGMSVLNAAMQKCGDVYSGQLGLGDQ
jgi:hypothetical protein